MLRLSPRVLGISGIIGAKSTTPQVTHIAHDGCTSIMHVNPHLVEGCCRDALIVAAPHQGVIIMHDADVAAY